MFFLLWLLFCLVGFCVFLTVTDNGGKINLCLEENLEIFFHITLLL